MDGAGALLRGVKDSMESAGLERQKLESAASSARAAQDAVIAATKESLHRVEATSDETVAAAVRRAETECRAAAKKAQTACEDAQERCMAVANEEVDRVVVKRIDKAVDAALTRRQSETATLYQSQRRDLELKADDMLESMARRRGLLCLLYS